jgi:hypothetical protein
MRRVTFLPAGSLSRDSALDRTTSSVQNYHGILPPTRARAPKRGGSPCPQPSRLRLVAVPRPCPDERIPEDGRTATVWSPGLRMATRYRRSGPTSCPLPSLDHRRVRPVEPRVHGPISKRQPFSLRSACFRCRSDRPAGLRVSKPQLVIDRRFVLFIAGSALSTSRGSSARRSTPRHPW